MSRNNTGNPIGSKAFPDFEDNVKNLDQTVNAEQDTFQDRLGKSRLTWAGIVKAGSGDPAIAVDAAARAVDAAGRAEAAEAIVDATNIKGLVNEAEAARDAAFINADVYATVAEGLAAVVDGEQFQVVEGDEIVRYRRNSASTQTEVARYPSAQGADAARQLGLAGRNLFDGALSPFLIELTGEVVSRPTIGESAVIQIEPGATYTVFRGNPTARLRISTLSEYPIDGAQSLRYWVGGDYLNSVTTPSSIRAEAGERWMVVDVSRSDNIRLHITKDYYDGPAYGLPSKVTFLGGVTAQNIKQGKNLFNGVWQHGTIAGDIGESPYVTTNNGKYTIIPIRPGTDYTVSKTESNRFKVTEWPLTMSGGAVLEDNESGNEFSFTSGPNAAYLGIYVAFGEGAPPPNFMQVEEASTRTEWERFGYKFTPAAEPYFKDSGGGGSSDPGPDVDVTGVEDATEALNYYFAQRAGREAPLPAGRLRVTGTVYYDGETLITGKGRATQIFLGDGFSLGPVTWRGGSSAYPIFCSRDGADFAVLRDFTIVGNRNQMADHRQFGVAVVDADHVKIENVGAEYINFFPDLAGGATTNALSWNLAILRSKHTSVTGGLFRFGGYENIGTEDAEDILFSGVRAGVGWRTSVQFHRGSQNIRWIGGSIYQNHPAAHSALTIHGSENNPVVGVLIDGMTMKSITNNSLDSRGGIQTVEMREHDITVTNSTIVVSNNGVVGGSDRIDPEPCKNWKLTNLMIKAGGLGIWMHGRGTQIDNVTIDSVGRALYLQDTSPEVGAVTCLDNQEVIVTESG